MKTTTPNPALFYTNEPTVTMRESPTHNSFAVSQTIFSEKVSIKSSYRDWSFITTPDGYSGWVPSHSIIQRDQVYKTSLKVSRLAAHLYHIKDTEHGPIKTLPFESRLQALDTTDPRWIKIALPDGQECYIQKGDVTDKNFFLSKNDLIPFSKQFLNLPYTWGGRSSFGYDCSSFTQMLYAQLGVKLERDAKQQVKDSQFKEISIEDIEPGDLIFWGRKEGRPSHVGMYIGDGQFIHAVVIENMPWIRISELKSDQWKDHAPNRPYRTILQLKK